MATTFPYVASGGPIASTIEQLRSTFPQQVTAETLRKWGIAPANESYVINVLKFLGILDNDGNKTEKAKVFTTHSDDDFAKQFAPIVADAYSDLFKHFNDAWNQSQDQLITFFRQSDDSSATVGKRQARTFITLAAYAGHGETPTPRKPSQSSSTKKKASTKKTPVTRRPPQGKGSVGGAETSNATGGLPHQHEVAMTVRLEINLPVADDQKVYDRIFASIRENLLNG